MRAKFERSLLSEIYVTCPAVKFHLFPFRSISAVVPFQCLLMTHLLLTQPTERDTYQISGSQVRMERKTEFAYSRKGIL